MVNTSSRILDQVGTSCNRQFGVRAQVLCTAPRVFCNFVPLMFLQDPYFSEEGALGLPKAKSWWEHWILYSPQKEEGNTSKWKCRMKDFVRLMHRELCPLIIHVLLYCCCLSFPVSTTSMPLKVKKTNENNHTTYGSLVIALAFGILFFLAVLVLIGRPWWYSFHRPRYSKVDYLMNGLWKILVLVGESYYLVGRQVDVDWIVVDIYYVLLREM